MGLFGKKYKCASCGASFGSEAELMTHNKMHMPKAALASFSCNACGMTFQSENELKRHQLSMHAM